MKQFGHRIFRIAGNPAMTSIALGVFLGAFLLFQVQPLVAKFILPWFGGAPAVWTSCMLFFQTLLLVGYVYADVVVRRLKPRWQGSIHVALLAGSLLFLPIIPSETWKPVHAPFPALHILALLGLTVGLPYLLLAATGPLLQGWLARLAPHASPYRLYALSNAGSLLGLLSYPFLFEPVLDLNGQAWVWSGGHLLFAVVSGWCAWQLIRSDGGRFDGQQTQVSTPRHAGPGQPFTWFDMLLALMLAACGSLMLLATTNQMCQDVAVVPFLWVLPLCVYLISFIVCFEKERWYVRIRFAMVLTAGLFLACVLLYHGASLGIRTQIAGHLFVLFACCMCCHGELVRLKPATDRLTVFYVVIAAGGATGGVLATVLAPLVLDGYWEYHLGLVAAGLLTLLAAGRDLMRNRGSAHSISPRDRRLAPVSGFASCLGLAALALVLGRHYRLSHDDAIELTRGFYGVLRVREYDSNDAARHRRVMSHGGVVHGFQFQDRAKRRNPTSYFGPASGVGVAVKHFPRTTERRGLRMGVVGLGAGTIAAYAEREDFVRFYEINPQVIRLCNQYFTYTQDAIARGATVEIATGDARMVMEQRLRDAHSEEFDVLVIDAFSGDSIPVHLITQECFELYWSHLKPDGVLALHITNRHVNLDPVVRTLAERSGKLACQIDQKGQLDKGTETSHWVLVTGNGRLAESFMKEESYVPWPDNAAKPLLWTDKFSSIFPLLK